MKKDPSNSAEEIISAILTEIKNYYEAVKDDKPFSEVKAIRSKINKLYSQLKELHPDSNFQLNKQLS